MNLVEYIIANRGDSSFIDKTPEEIASLLLFHLNNDTIVTHRTEHFEIDGVLLWHIQKYIPLTVNIVECISTGKSSMSDMFNEFVRNMPSTFICFGYRKKHKKILDYKNPRRLIKLLENYV